MSELDDFQKWFGDLIPMDNGKPWDDEAYAFAGWEARSEVAIKEMVDFANYMMEGTGQPFIRLLDYPHPRTLSVIKMFRRM